NLSGVKPVIHWISLVPERNGQGEIIGAIAFGRDVTVKRETEYRLRHVVDHLPGVACSLKRKAHGDLCMPFASEGIEALCGCTASELFDTLTPLFQRMGDEEVWRLKTAFQASAQFNTLMNEEFGLRLTASAPQRWLQLKAAPERLPDGSLTWNGLLLDVTERKQAQLQQELLGYAIDAASDGVHLVDARGRIRYANAGFCRVLGYDADEILQLSLSEIDPDFTSQQHMSLAETLKKGEVHCFETRHRRKDGHIFPVEIIATPIQYGGDLYSLAIARDISERQQMMALLARSEKEFRTLADNLPDHVIRWDVEGRVQYLNETNIRVMGHIRDAMVGTKSEEPCPDGRFASIDAAVMRVAVSGHPENLMRQPVQVQGSWELHDIKLVPERDASGQVIGVLGIGRDMTELYHLQESVAERELEFRSLAENLPDFIVRYDRACRVVYVNPKLGRVLQKVLGRSIAGETPNETCPDGIFSQYDAALRRVLATGEMEDLEIMPRDENNNIQFHLIRMVAERNPAGEVTGALAIGRDVTASREAQNRLNHIVDNLPGMAFSLHVTPEGEGGIHYASSGLEHLFGLQVAEVRHDLTPIFQRIHPEDRGRVSEHLVEAGRNQQPLQTEFRICRPDCPVKWLELRSVVERQLDGHAIWYGFLLDISVRRKAIEKLEETLDFNEKLLQVMPDPVFVKDRQ
ncbi:MAG: PAS domain S-box protein, partial [Magnetococcales bacterium]|nr:PAS domain S-box protein [Magnetococcales bacterium]